MTRTILDLAQLPKTPWKNGGGLTTDLAVEPAGAGWDDCIWRVGIAEIAREGPFSHLPGIRRLFVPLLPGVSLAIGAAQPRRISAFEIVDFSGDDRTECRLDADAARRGPLAAFNLMLRRGQAEGAVHCHAGAVRLPAPGAGLTALFVARGGFTVVGADGQPLPLDAGKALLHRRTDERLAAEPYKPWSILVVAEAKQRIASQ